MTPGPEDDISQAEKRYVMRQDADVRDRSRNGDTGTYLSHTHDDTSGGRFAAIGTPTVVGRDAVIKYPAAAAHQHDPCGPEPPTGYDINEMTPLDPSADSILPVEAAGDVPSAAQVPAAIRVAEYDKENPGKSNRVVADAVGVDEKTVRKARADWSAPPDTVIGRDGKTYQARRAQQQQDRADQRYTAKCDSTTSQMQPLISRNLSRKRLPR